MREHRFQFSAKLSDAGGGRLGDVLLDVDWEPALECARFEWFRASNRAPDLDARIEPVWEPQAGPPRVLGFRVLADGGDAPGAPPVEFSQTFFGPAVRKAAAPFIRSGRLGGGDRIVFVPSAHPVAAVAGPAPAEGPAMAFGEVRERWPVSEATLMVPGELTGGDDVPVVVPSGLLDTVADRSRGAGEVETGGVLVGHLRRDPASSALWIEVTGELAARHTVAEMTKLTFTPRTWTDAREQLGLREGGELMLGWWHSHLGRAVCRACPDEAREVCQFSRGFFSGHDRHFQRTAFPRAWQLGLVVNDAATGKLSFSLFGWRRGEIEARDFQTI
jgi:hypothetical protein